MKRFLAFAGEVYDPFGGWRDFVKSADTAEEAEAVCVAELARLRDFLDTPVDCWFHVVDTETGKICRSSREGECS